MNYQEMLNKASKVNESISSVVVINTRNGHYIAVDGRHYEPVAANDEIYSDLNYVSFEDELYVR